VGSVLGAVGGYALGYFLWLSPDGGFSGLAEFFFRHVFSTETYYQVKEMYEQNNFWVVFTAGFTPIPYKLITITAGVFNIQFWMFIVASVVSRGLRFFLVSGLIWRFGPPIKTFIDKYFNWLAIAFTVLLIGGFVLIKYLL
jgi:membrane protein YqaA with SNARE-associated domain